MNRTKVASGGFSLIEVMIVLVIIGVLLLVATPGYQESMRKSHRAGGMRDLMELVSRQERFYAQNSRYTNVIKTPTGLNFMPNDNDDDDPDKPTLSSEGHYDLRVALCKNPDQVDFSTCYNLLATPRGKQAEDACGTLNADSKGKRGHSGPTELTCW